MCVLSEIQNVNKEMLMDMNRIIHKLLPHIDFFTGML